MRDATLLIDFGSTYTKLVAVDEAAEEILGTAQSPTTVETDISEGLRSARALLERTAGPLAFPTIRACSSAAGGLRMIVSGLVLELTAKAARLAALGGGGKILKVFAGKLTGSDIDFILNSRPDLFLLTGGTDGGEEKCILTNAERLARSGIDCPILIAGNRNAADECGKILSAAGKPAMITPNVLPRLDQLNIRPVQDQIRKTFLSQIIHAKGLSRMETIMGEITMPTPVSVLKALTLLSKGVHQSPGLGPLMAIDLGGATTDVYSIADGAPENSNTYLKGLIDPYEKRSVEGDIGMRISIHGILEAAGAERIARIAEASVDEVNAWADKVQANHGLLPRNEREARLDHAFACAAVQAATIRHAGTIEESYTPAGQIFIQEGKDLRSIETVVLIGGALIHAAAPREIAAFASYSKEFPSSLRPNRVDVLLDKKYILSAMGVLSEINPESALSIMKKEIIHA